jgi:hypothetical protein
VLNVELMNGSLVRTAVRVVEMSVIHMAHLADLADVSAFDYLTAFERHAADLIQTPAGLDAMELPRDTAQVTP